MKLTNYARTTKAQSTFLVDQISDGVAVAVPDSQVQPIGQRLVTLWRLPELDREVRKRLFVGHVVDVSGVDGDEATSTHRYFRRAD